MRLRLRASLRPARGSRSWLLARASSLRVREPFVLLALQARRASEAVSPELKRRLRKDACLSRVRGSLCAPAKLPARAFATHRTPPNLSRMHSAGCLAVFRSSFIEHLSFFVANRELSIDFAGSCRLRGFAGQQKPRSRKAKIPRKPAASRKSIDNAQSAAFFAAARQKPDVLRLRPWCNPAWRPLASQQGSSFHWGQPSLEPQAQKGATLLDLRMDFWPCECPKVRSWDSRECKSPSQEFGSIGDAAKLAEIYT